MKDHCSFHCDLTCTTASPVRKNRGSSTLQVQLHLHDSAASWLMSTTTKCDIRLVCRQRERILCCAAFRAASGTALERQTAGGTASGRIVALTSEQAVKSDTQESLSEDTVLRIAGQEDGRREPPCLAERRTLIADIIHLLSDGPLPILPVFSIQALSQIVRVAV